MSNDTELFELCKEVYERLPDWDGDKPHKSWYQIGHYFSDGKEYQPGEPFLEEHSGQFPEFPYKYIAPLYTSDYLLEKLPKHLESQEKLNVTYFDEVPETGEICWRAEYTHLFADGTWYIRWEYQGNGDTPLKALLKLVIALDDAGVNL